MPLATLILADGTIKPIEDKQTAVNAWKARYTAPTGLTAAQQSYAAQIKSVLLPPSWQPDNYQTIMHPDPTTKLTHTGIEQGKTQMLPVNDR